MPNVEEEPVSDNVEDASDADEGDDDMLGDLALLADFQIDSFQKRIVASEDVMENVNQYFEKSNVAGETEVTRQACSVCNEEGFMATCTARRPWFPDLTLFSFTCPECSHREAAVRTGEAKGASTSIRVTFTVTSQADLRRDLVKSDTACVLIPALGMEMASGTLGDTYMSVGGVLDAVLSDLDNAMNGLPPDALDAVKSQIKELKEVKKPWSFTVEDPLGYVFIGPRLGEEARGVDVDAEDETVILVEGYMDEVKLPEDNHPEGYADTQEFLKEACEQHGLLVAEPEKYKQIGLGCYATKNIKKGDVIGHMYGRFYTEFKYSDRYVECEALKYRFKTDVYMDGAAMCPVTYINDPSFGTPKTDGVQANCLLSFTERASPHDANFLCSIAMVDIEASPEKPVELWMEYRPTEASQLAAEADVEQEQKDLATITKEVLQEGDGKTFPERGDTLRMHYTGTLASTGAEFDSSRARDEPLTFTIGVGQVIRGWDLGVMRMSLGERAKLQLPAALGYGAAGAGDVIPPDSDLVFDVELLSISSLKANKYNAM